MDYETDQNIEMKINRTNNDNNVKYTLIVKYNYVKYNNVKYTLIACIEQT